MSGPARFIAAALAFGLSVPSHAQSAADEPASEDSISPKTITTPGGSQMLAASMLAAMRLEQKARDYCFEYGCLVIVNESENWKVTRFHVQEADRKGRLRWSANQFGKPLLARRATFRFKTGGANACELPVMFVLRHNETKEELSIEGRAALCKTPKLDSLLRINVQRPRVIVGEPDATN